MLHGCVLPKPEAAKQQKACDKAAEKQQKARKQAGALSENEGEAIIIGTVSSSIFT